MPGLMRVNLLGMHSRSFNGERIYFIREILGVFIYVLIIRYRFSQVVNDAFSLRRGSPWSKDHVLRTKDLHFGLLKLRIE